MSHEPHESVSTACYVDEIRLRITRCLPGHAQRANVFATARTTARIWFTSAVKNVVPGYAVIRLDLDRIYSDEDRYTVKRIVWTEDQAAAEVERLNRLNADKNCRYFWQYTRVDKPPT
jgi:hypothetical protein